MKLGRNDPCHCGSGNKYKRCCAEKDEAAKSAELAAQAKARASADAEAEAKGTPKKAPAPHGSGAGSAKPHPKAPPPKGSPIRRRAV